MPTNNHLKKINNKHNTNKTYQFETMEKISRDIEYLVNYITNCKSLTREQRSKRDYLLARDLSMPKSDTTSISKDEGNQPNTRICEFHKPQKVFEFLHKFTLNNTALKYTTHFWDKNPEDGKYAFDSFEDFKFKYKEDLESGDCCLSSIYTSCKHLWAIVKNFLIQDNPKYTWGEHKLKIGYNKYVGEWMSANTDHQPASMPLSSFPEEIQPKGLINGKVLSYFGDVIEIFKRCIEFRDNDLYISVWKIFKSADHNIDKKELEFLKGRAIYTDTELVKDALRIIAGNIFQRPMYPELKISCESSTSGEGKTLQLRILQVGSYSNRDVNDSKMKAAEEEGDFHRIKDKIRNLCDFAVESKFRIGNEIRHCRINYLSSKENTDDIVFIDDAECEGFTYILTFYTI